MKKLVACTALGIFSICCAAEVNAQAKRPAGQKGVTRVGPAQVAAPRVAVPRSAAVNQPIGTLGILNNNGAVSHAAQIHNPGNIYTNGYSRGGNYNPVYTNPGYSSAGYYSPGYSNVASITPYAYVGPAGTGYFFPAFGNPFGLYGIPPGYNSNYIINALSRMNYLANSNPNAGLYPPGAGLVLGVVSGAAPPPTAANTASKDDIATVQIVAPSPDAEVTLDDFATTATGQARTFHTPVLEAGYRYGYSVVATWIQNGEQLREVRSIDVFPGQVTVVDFTRPAVPELVAVPPEKADSAKP